MIVGVFGSIVLAMASVAGAAAPPTDVAIEDYMGAFTESDPAAAQAYARSDSPAWWYAVFKSAQAAASEQMGDPLAPIAVKASGGTAELCPEDPSLPCATFAGFEADDAGRIVTFTVNGNDIAPRLGPGGDPVGLGSSASAQLLVSYRTVTNEALLVAVEVTTSAVGDFGSVATFEATDGERVEAVDTFGVTALDGGTSVILLVFPPMDPGGQLTWSATIDGVATPVMLAVPPLSPDGAVTPPPTTKQ